MWIHFVVNASFGFALGFDRESPGLMSRRPRPHGESVLTRPVLVTVGLGGLGGLGGLAITCGLLGLIKLGQAHFGSVETGQSIAFTAFALCLIVAAFECRSETESVLTPSDGLRRNGRRHRRSPRPDQAGERARALTCERSGPMMQWVYGEGHEH
ncbi:cation-translocating P-type ATPase C-terminal domain-containing protein [Streptomyces sp. NBC_00005]